MALRLIDLPASWGSRGQVERLAPDAAASLSRVLARAVAESGTNFQLNDAYRSKAEQIALFVANYRNRGTGSKRASSDRMYGGTAWRHVTNVAVASPDLYGTGTGANHTRGVAIDIVPAGIQRYLQREGIRSGWSWAEGERNGEPWHFVYEEGRDQHRSEGTLDHAAVQKAVGAEVDGKIGTGTVAKIKAFQKSKGLEVDGKVGPATKAAMGLGKGSAPVASKPAGKPKPKPSTAVGSYKLDEQKSPNAYDDRKGHKVTSITVHWWGTPVGQKRDGIVAWLTNPKANVSAHYVVTAGHVTQLVDESCGSWANGNKTANLESITIECDPNDPAGTAPTVAALISDIRGRHGDIPIYPHQHWTATECPGDYLPLLPAIDAMARGNSANLGRPIVTPAAPAIDLPTGKALLMELKDLPDFPLLRTGAHKCYYGDEAKMEAVTGKMPNSMNPGEIFGSGKSSGAHGLKAWQKAVGIEADGRYGSGTKAAARSLQKRAGLTVDGKIGPSTFYAAFLAG